MGGEGAKATASMKPIAASAFGPSQARRLMWRAGFGGTPAQAQVLAEWGPEQSVDTLLNVEEALVYPAPKADDFDGSIMGGDVRAQRRAEAQARRAQDEDELARLRRQREERERNDRRQIREMQRWWLTRMIETSRPFEEKMALFWHGHFATSYRTIENSYHMFLQNEMFRRQAAGSYAQLLDAIIRDPAMLAYLDNNDSRKEKPNENLARELMELFSLGEGNYSEKDIKEGARSLTGYTFEGNEFAFRAERHDDGVKSILGRTGRLKGEDFVVAILARPACSEFIAFKLYRFFIGDLPPTGSPMRQPVISYIRNMAATLRSGKYALRPMLRKMLLSEHFYDTARAPARVKSPAELVVGAMRSLRTPARDLNVLTDAMDLMGQNLFFPPSVKGWDGGRSWINTSTLFVRMNIANFLLTGRLPRGYDAMAGEERYDAAPILEGVNSRTRKDPDLLAAHILDCALCVEVSAEKREALAVFIRSRGQNDLATTVGESLSLVAAMPEYQLC